MFEMPSAVYSQHLSGTSGKILTHHSPQNQPEFQCDMSKTVKGQIVL